MKHTIRLGYRRLQDGRTEPICEPTIMPYLAELWRHACLCQVYGDEFAVTGTVGNGFLQVRGRLEPRDEFQMVAAMASEAVMSMSVAIKKIDAQFPFDSVVEVAISSGGRHLMMSLGDAFVRVEPTPLTNGNLVVVSRVEYEGARCHVVVSGHPNEHPFAEWVNGVIRDRVRDAILERIARDTDA